MDVIGWTRQKLRKRLRLKRAYLVGRFELTLPYDHKLDDYQRRYRLTDTALGEIARFVLGKYPRLTAIDIGANIGDTAAAICRHVDVPVLCIEGHPDFLGFLRANLHALPAGTETAECLVGTDPCETTTERLHKAGGTASLHGPSQNGSGATRLSVKPLAQILLDHPRFAFSKLVKIDTDGSDFAILRSANAFIEAIRPVLFFEYDPKIGDDGYQQSLDAIDGLMRAGYDSFLLYDNFGNFVRMIEGDVVEQFADVNRYLKSHSIFGTAVYYFDVAAFHHCDRDLAGDVRDFHRLTIDRFIGSMQPPAPAASDQFEHADDERLAAAG
jgi:FkbM family methyltransferase